MSGTCVKDEIFREQKSRSRRFILVNNRRTLCLWLTTVDETINNTCCYCWT